ncbi:MAG: trigger factor [Pirellulales bacterium]
MSSDPLEDAGDTLQQESGAEEQAEPLHLDVKVESPSACERHVTVTIAREDIDRYFDEAYSELMPTATVPGFRPGRAPRKLVEGRYRKDISNQIKGSLLMDSLEQISEEQEFTAISEPDFDLDAIEVPEEGPMTFEFNIEVRPEFDLPEWKGLKVERPVKEFTDEDVDRRVEQILARFGSLTPYDGPAEKGDYLTVTVTTHHDGQELSVAREEVVRVLGELSFRDGRLKDFDKLMVGVKPNETRKAEIELTEDAPNEDLRGKKVEARFEVLEVKKLKLPELTEEFLGEMGDFESVKDLRAAVRADLERQLEYHQQQRVRRQITSALVASATWDLPQQMLRRQSARELQRTVLELRRSGFSEAEIRARENELRQNSAQSTAAALKEHFILERIAEEESIDVEPEDYDREIVLIAMQSGESTRRVRAQLEKRGMMDVLRNQILERKVIELVRSHAQFKDEPLKQDDADVETMDVAAGGGEDESDIPAVKQGSES